MECQPLDDVGNTHLACQWCEMLVEDADQDGAPEGQKHANQGGQTPVAAGGPFAQKQFLRAFDHESEEHHSQGGNDARQHADQGGQNERVCSGDVPRDAIVELPLPTVSTRASESWAWIMPEWRDGEWLCAGRHGYYWQSPASRVEGIHEQGWHRRRHRLHGCGIAAAPGKASRRGAGGDHLALGGRGSGRRAVSQPAWPRVACVHLSGQSGLVRLRYRFFRDPQRHGHAACAWPSGQGCARD